MIFIKQDKINEIKQILEATTKHVRFEEEDHSYYVGDNKIKSVSKFIEPWNSQFINMMNPDHKSYNNYMATRMPYFQQRGTMVHKLSEGVDTGNYMYRWPGKLKNYEAYYKLFHRKYIKSGLWSIIGIETRVYSKKWNVAGTIDRLFIDNKTGKIILLDIKSGSCQPINNYQQTMYALMLSEMDIKVSKCYLLSLKDGMYLKLISKSQLKLCYKDIQDYLQSIKYQNNLWKELNND